MKKKTITDVDVNGKRVFVRVDFNVPLDDSGNITDDTRIKAALPTLRHLIEAGAKIVCASHMGRPKGKRVAGFSLKPVARRLSQLLDRPVAFTGETIGAELEEAKAQLKEGDVLLLENLRYHAGEKKNDDDFAKQLAANIDVYINDAFGACHRAHASIVKLAENVDVTAAGYLLEKEIDFLNMATNNPPQKYSVILGGAKVSDKIPVITNLLDRAQKIFIGGAMAYTFLKALGQEVGHSLVEDQCIETCREIMEKAKKKNVRLFLPIDHVAAIKIEPEVTVRMIKRGRAIPPEMMGLDIGFDTIEQYSRELKDSELIVWNGPMGVFEIDTFSAGTMEVAKVVAASNATSIIGGGDSVAAVNKSGLADCITHISTGGGASLEFLSGKILPGVQALADA